MATWAVHLRVGEKILKTLQGIDETAFYVGCIAPDSGRMVDDFTYLPPKDVSHWKREGVSYEQRFEDNAEFYKKYAENERDNKMFSFFLGYYVHILTDTIYVRDIIHPYMFGRGKELWRKNIKAIRKGWYEIDARFLAKNRPYYPLELVGTATDFENTVLDYFTRTDIGERMKYAYDFYSNSQPDYSTELITHDEKKTDEIIEYASEFIRELLKTKHNI